MFFLREPCFEAGDLRIARNRRVVAVRCNVLKFTRLLVAMNNHRLAVIPLARAIPERLFVP